jgi:hypothetical protein
MKGKQTQKKVTQRKCFPMTLKIALMIFFVISMTPLSPTTFELKANNFSPSVL